MYISGVVAAVESFEQREHLRGMVAVSLLENMISAEKTEEDNEKYERRERGERERGESGRKGEV